jgi:hypothetical protein
VVYGLLAVLWWGGFLKLLKIKIMRQVILGEDEMIIKRELVFDLIRFMADHSSKYDSKMAKYILGKRYNYETNQEFNEVLIKLNDEDLETLLLIASP